MGLKRARDRDLLAEVVSAVREWPRFAEEASMLVSQRDAIARAHRMYLQRSLGPEQAIAGARRRTAAGEQTLAQKLVLVTDP